MADDTETAAATERSADVDLQLAGLSTGAGKDATHAIEQMEHDGTYNEAAAQQAIHDAQLADQARQDLDMHQHDQAKAADEGNIELAKESATAAGYDIKEVSEHGLDANAHIVDAQADHNWFDQQHLDQAGREHATEVAYADSAASNAAAGDSYHAAADAQVAADHHDAAADHTHDADAGGTYASHDSASDPSADHSATADPSTEAA